jgi:phosphate transport system substrate-binding protein
MDGVLRLWEHGFEKHHPGVLFKNQLHGTASGIAGLYAGAAELAVMGREIWPIEVMAYQSVFSRAPLQIDVATGSYDIPKSTYALVIYVHKSNPLSKLTLDQLAAVFGLPEGPGAAAIRTWDQLGLPGKWAGRPIHTYSFDYDNDKSVFFRRRVFQKRYRWDSRTREFSNVINSNGESQEAGKLILEALAQDPLGIAVSNPHYAIGNVRALSLDVDGNAVAATPETVRQRTYPLTRAVYIYTNRDPKRALENNIAAFLRYILSDEGQREVIKDGTYLPLTPEGAAVGRRVLDAR